MEIIKGQHYHLTEISDTRVELSSTLFHAFIAGIVDLCSDGYDIIYQASSVRGNMFIAFGDKTENHKQKDRVIDVTEKANEKLVKENKNLKSQIARLKNKISKLEETKQK